MRNMSVNGRFTDLMLEADMQSFRLRKNSRSKSASSRQAGYRLCQFGTFVAHQKVAKVFLFGEVSMRVCSAFQVHLLEQGCESRIRAQAV
jgi:hypothetical protein